MRKFTIAAAALFAVAGLAACNSPADEKAEQQADALESQAAATPNEAEETMLNEKADQIEQQAGDADGGMTTENTPETSPSEANPGQPAQ
jgi:ABC-type glycerol-3-phosphate transport system substrate-binding protein